MCIITLSVIMDLHPYWLDRQLTSSSISAIVLKILTSKKADEIEMITSGWLKKIPSIIYFPIFDSNFVGLPRSRSVN